jgi:hypothetical protein
LARRNYRATGEEHAASGITDSFADQSTPWRREHTGRGPSNHCNHRVRDGNLHLDLLDRTSPEGISTIPLDPPLSTNPGARTIRESLSG